MPHNTCKYCGCDVLGNAEYCDYICRELDGESESPYGGDAFHGDERDRVTMKNKDNTQNGVPND